MLRALTLSACLVAANPAIADEAEPLVDYAPGAQGIIRPSIPEMIDEARQRGARLLEELTPLEADDFGVQPDLDGMRARALNDPRVRALLGVDGGGAEPAATEPRYGSARVYLFASFSMPPASLRTMMVEAQRLEVPIVFQGFVENSVFATQTALQTVFGEDADTVGFGIDPTMFVRFSVESVPQLIVLRDPLEVCEMQGCVGEAPPPHDVIRGNIPLEAGLEIIARGQGDAPQVAAQLLARVGR